jgi:hypothetical protein
VRKPAAKNKPRIAQAATFVAATSGWIANTNVAAANAKVQGAYMLQNFFPLTTTIMLRRGSVKYATLGNGGFPVGSMMTYKNGGISALFAATEDSIYDISTVSDAGVSPVASVTGMTSGEWSSVQYATTGGTYLVNVNASDDMQIYDGSAWWDINANPTNRLNFDTQTANFHIGSTITGATSGTTAVIRSMVDNGTTGYLVLGVIAGTGFVDNEIISGGGGSATVNGPVIPLFVAFSGIATNQLSYVWSYKSRLFFIEKNSQNAWYLPIDASSGAAVKFPMGGIFTLGGSLLFGTSWSLDTSGQGGLSEQCVFVSTEGEVVVYQGDNPATASTWSKVGTYLIGKPLGPKAWIRAGGDIIIATNIGLVPLSVATQKDYAALSPSAVSYAIEAEWNQFVSLRAGSDWCCKVWPESQMVITALPTVNYQPARMLVSNARTGAWAEYTGWDGKCLEVFNGRLFFGSQNGKVVEANVSGADQGSTYTGVFVPLFSDQKSPGSLKVMENARVFMRGPREPTPGLNCQFDYVYASFPAPSAPIIAGGSEWGSGIWGEAVWGSAAMLSSYEQWVSVGGAGYALAPDVRLTSGAVVPLDTEIVRVEMTYDIGDILS